jgi:hypothetical protein
LAQLAVPSVVNYTGRTTRTRGAQTNGTGHGTLRETKIATICRPRSRRPAALHSGASGGQRPRSAPYGTIQTAMDAYAQLGQPEPAQQILKQMLLLARQSTATGAVTTRHRALQPDAVSLATIATAWAKSHRVEAVPKTLALLTYMEQQNLATSNHAYNIALAAIVASPEHNSSNRGNYHKAAPAQAILERMQQRAAQGYSNCAPDLYTYQTYMTALSHTRQRDTPDIVMAVLEFLTTQSDPTSPATTRAHLAPNAHCYTAAIHAWAYSKAPHKARNAYDLLQTMRRRHEVDGRLDCRPNVVVFTAVLNACVKPLPDDRNGIWLGATRLRRIAAVGIRPTELSHLRYFFARHTDVFGRRRSASGRCRTPSLCGLSRLWTRWAHRLG